MNPLDVIFAPIETPIIARMVIGGLLVLAFIVSFVARRAKRSRGLQR